jgi:spermidine synthase
MPLSRNVILAITFLVAACSIVYELVIARMIAQYAGDAVVWESVSIGLYILALGCGAFLFEHQRKAWGESLLLRTEILLTVIGALAGFTVMTLHIIYRISYYDDGMLRGVLPVEPVLAFTIPAQLVTVMVGLLSGFELPALLEAAAKTGTARSDAKVLGTYYAGTLCGTLLFGLSHKLNVDDLHTSLTAASVNLLVAATLIPTATRRWRLPLGGMLCGLAGGIAALVAAVAAATQLHAKNF